MDTLLLLELTDNLTEALAGLEKAKDDTLATLDAIDAVNDALIALGGEGIAPIVKDYTKLLQSIINGELNIHQTPSEYDTLKKAHEDENTDPDLLTLATVAAARQVIEANGHVVVN